MKKLEERVAIITGSSRGIGKGIALKFAEYGARVIVTYLTRLADAENVAKEINGKGGIAIALNADVTSIRDIERVFHIGQETFGRIDIVVNNAGSVPQPSAWDSITDNSWKQSIDINLAGVFNCTRVGVTYLRDAGDGCILNIASTYGFLIPDATVIAYAAAKAGVVALTRSFAKEFAPKIRVNCIAPGIVDTDMTAAAPKAFLEQQIARTPLSRIGTPEDVAETALFLCSPSASFITGQVLVVDGGHSLW